PTRPSPAAARAAEVSYPHRRAPAAAASLAPPDRDCAKPAPHNCARPRSTPQTRPKFPSSLSSAPADTALLWPPRCAFFLSSLTSSFTPPLTFAAELISLISSRFLI